MSTFNPSDLFLLQRPSDTADPYKAVTRDSMKALGIMTSDVAPTNDEEGQLWFKPASSQLYIYEGGQWVEAAGSTHNLNLKVSRTGDSMTGDLIMLGEADVNFPLNGGLTLGNENTGGGHMVLVSYDSDVKPQGFLTIPSQAGGLDTIAKWDGFGLYVLKDPVEPAHVTHKKYVDDENHLQDLIIEQNATNIIALFDDFESVRPSALRAKYDYMIPGAYGGNTPDGRIYFGDGVNIQTTYNDTITEIYFNKKANNGITYDFSDVTQDYVVEVQDVKGIGIFLANVDTITEISDQIKIELNVIKHRDDGTLVGDPEPTEVRLLIFRNSVQIDIDAEDRFAKLYEPNTFTKNNTFKGPGVYIDSIAPLPGSVGFVNSNVFSVVNGATGLTPGKDRFKINARGEVTAGTVPEPFMAQFDNDVVTKKYVDERMARVGAYYGDNPPPNPVPGMLWYDTKEDDLTMYMYYENPDNTFVWVPVYSPSKGGGGGGSPFIPTSDRYGEVYSTQDELNRFLLDGSLYKNENDSYVIDQGEELEQSTNALEIKGRVGPVASLNYGSLLSVKRREKLSPASDYVTYDGSIDKPNAIVTKQYVDRTDNLLNDKVNNLREELEAISPILVRGQWKIDHISTAGRAPSPGFFAIYKIASDYEFITDFIESHEVWIAEEDTNKVFHDFTEELILDKYIYIYDADDKDYVLGVITSLEETIFRSNKYYKMIIKPLQAKGLPHDDDVCFIKIFDPPTGGDGSQFVTKSDFEEITKPLSNTIINATYTSGTIGTDSSEVNQFSVYIDPDYTEIYFRIEHRMAVEAAYNAESIIINGVEYEANYYKEDDFRGSVEIDTTTTPDGFDGLEEGDEVEFILPKVCCYDDRLVKNEISDRNREQNKLIYEVGDHLQQDMLYPIYKGTMISHKSEINNFNQLSISYPDGYGANYAIQLFGTISDDVVAVGDKILIDFGDGVFHETVPLVSKNIYNHQYTYLRFGYKVEWITPLPEIPEPGTEIRIKFPGATATKSIKLSEVLKDAVEVSTDFDSLKTNLIQALDNFTP